MAERPASISFEDFTATTLRAVKSALDTKGPRLFVDPDILIGIYLRRARDIPELENLNQAGKGR